MPTLLIFYFPIPQAHQPTQPFLFLHSTMGAAVTGFQLESCRSSTMSSIFNSARTSIYLYLVLPAYFQPTSSFAAQFAWAGPAPRGVKLSAPKLLHAYCNYHLRACPKKKRSGSPWQLRGGAPGAPGERPHQYH